MFAKDNYRNMAYVDLNTDRNAHRIFDGDLDVDSIILALSAHFPDLPLTPYETVIVLDEIQECPRAIAVLKPFSEDPRYDLIASRSLLGLRLKEVTLMPVRQEDRISMHTMDFEEFLWALGINDTVLEHVRTCITERRPIGDSVHAPIMKYLKWYMLTGGMPEVVATFVSERRFDGVRRVQDNIIQDYMDDIAKHCDDNQKLRTEICFNSLSRHLAKDNKRFVASDVEGDLKYRPSIAKYEYAINWLYRAKIVNECRRVTDFQIPTEEKGVDDNEDGEGAGGFKLYMNDTGLLSRLYDPSVYSEILKGNIEVNRGALTENLIASMLTIQGRKLLYLEITRSIEVDFILTVKENQLPWR